MQKDDGRADNYVLGLTNNCPHSTNAAVRHVATVRSLLLSKYIEWLRKNEFACINSRFKEIEKIEWADWRDTYSDFQLMGIWADLEQEELGSSLKKIARLSRYE